MFKLHRYYQDRSVFSLKKKNSIEIYVKKIKI
jgi:hypothetical protein